MPTGYTAAILGCLTGLKVNLAKFCKISKLLVFLDIRDQRHANKITWNNN